MFGKGNSEIVRELREVRSILERLDRKLDMQGTAHSAIMNQNSAHIALSRDEFQKVLLSFQELAADIEEIHKRISFSNSHK